MNYLIQLDDQLMHAPSGVIVALFAVAVGYVLKSSAFFKNQYIPLVIVLFTSVFFPVVEACAAVGDGKPHPFLSIPLNLMIGVIIGFAAWAFHSQVLKRWVDPKLFNDDGSTKFFVKPAPDEKNENQTKEIK